MRSLALDLGMTCGWCLGVGGERLASGVWLLGKDRTRGRFDEFHLRLLSCVQAQRIDVIVYEHVRRHAGTTAAHVYGGWLAQLDTVHRRTNVRLVGVRTQDLHAAADVESASRKAFPDKEKRRAENKRRMVAAAHARGWPVADDNEAEACFVHVAGQRALSQGAGA